MKKTSAIWLHGSATSVAISSMSKMDAVEPVRHIVPGGYAEKKNKTVVQELPDVRG